MRILLTNRALAARGGSESYLETIAPELRRLEHEVVLYAPQCGELAESLRAAGFRVVDSVSDIPDDLDVIHGQHRDAVARVRSRFPSTPLVYASHSWFIPLEEPVAELAASAYLTFNDRTFARLAAHEGIQRHQIVRLTQPVTVTHGHSARTPIRPQVERVAVVSRNLIARTAELRDACDRLGLHLTLVGALGAESRDARTEMMSADVVVAIGRTALEAMALGRAVLIADESTVSGWMTAESYPALEAAGFVGSGLAVSPASVVELLEGYEPELGTAARTLALSHHAAPHHAAALVEVYRSVLGAAPTAGAGDALATVTAEHFGQAFRIGDLEWLSAEQQREIDALRDEVSVLRAHVATLEGSASWRWTAPVRAVRGAVRRSR
jgi:O-antigen biosynthesis protein